MASSTLRMVSPVGAALALLASQSLLAPGEAAAQTWVDGRTTPALLEIISIDKTGEPGWLYGAEDVLGDTLESFKQQEQSIDIRTAYAAADMNRFWARIYVSEQNAVGGNVTIFVFLDVDQSAATGGSAAAPEIDPKFTSDASPGGYDYVFGVRGNASITEIWKWDSAQMAYVGAVPPAAQALAESGQDVDPIQINLEAHGYLQGMIDLALLGLTPECKANIYVRSINAAAALGTGDLEVGQVAPCIPADANNDNIPDIVVPVSDCTEDAQCPGDGICVDGTCIFPAPCLADTDCKPDEECAPEGHCLPKPTGPCASSVECGDLVCRGGLCSPCDPDLKECAVGQRCAPTGHCVKDDSVSSGSGGFPPLATGEGVQGGAFNCAVSPEGSRGLTVFGGLAAAVGLVWRRRARRSGGRSAK